MGSITVTALDQTSLWSQASTLIAINMSQKNSSRPFSNPALIRSGRSWIKNLRLSRQRGLNPYQSPRSQPTTWMLRIWETWTVNYNKFVRLREERSVTTNSSKRPNEPSNMNFQRKGLTAWRDLAKRSSPTHPNRLLQRQQHAPPVLPLTSPRRWRVWRIRRA